MKLIAPCGWAMIRFALEAQVRRCLRPAKVLLALISVATSFASIAAHPCEAGASTSQRALIVAIGEYADDAISDLKGPHSDGPAMVRFATQELGFPAESICLITNAAATKAAVHDALGTWLIDGLAADGRFLFYFSGHGSQTADHNEDEADGLDEVLVMHDAARRGKPADRNLLLDDEIAAIFSRAGRRRGSVILDACFSGTATRDSGADGEGARSPPDLDGTSSKFSDRSVIIKQHREEGGYLGRRDGISVWSASSNAQLAWDDLGAAPPRGFFTHAMIEALQSGLADRDHNGTTTVQELLTSLRTSSADFCMDNRSCKARKEGLTPVIEVDPALWTQDARRVLAATALTAPEPMPAMTVVPSALSDLSAGLTVELLSRTTPLKDWAEVSEPVAIGQRMRIKVISEWPSGYLTVLESMPDGRLRKIAPLGSNPPIHIARKVVVPDSYARFQYEASEPAGKYELIAVLTDVPIVLDTTSSKKETVAGKMQVVPLSRRNEVLQSIAAQLAAPWTDDPTTRPVRWAAAFVEYTASQAAPIPPIRDHY